MTTRPSNVVRNFRDLEVWREAHELTLAVYRATSSFPAPETYGLTGQIRRSSSSIPANIAEGCGRGTSAEVGRFVQIARGSASELEYHLLLARDLDYLPDDIYEHLTTLLSKVQKMLTSYRRALQAQLA
jgi:four helix bundle protein